MTSHNPNDVRESYCGNCHDWTGEGVPCLIKEWHPSHVWTPLVADPENDHVLHLLGVSVRCPGVR